MPDPTEFDTAFEEFELVPPLEDPADLEDQLDAAELSALDDPLAVPAQPPTPVPFGRTWSFDYIRRRFVRTGYAPAEVRNYDALAQWLLSAWHTSAGAHPILPDDYGLVDADAWIGWADPTETLTDLQNDLTGAALQHDRVEDIDDVVVRWDPQEGIVTIDNMTVITDEEEALPLLEVDLSPEL